MHFDHLEDRLTPATAINDIYSNLILDTMGSVSAGSVKTNDWDAITTNAELVAGPSAPGTFTLNTDGEFNFHPIDANNPINTSFTYRLQHFNMYAMEWEYSNVAKVTLEFSPVAVNQAPVVSVSDFSSQAGILTSLQISAVDPDAGDTITEYYANNYPMGFTFNTNTGYFAGTPQYAGNYTVEVKAKDNHNLWSPPKLFNWTVSPGNPPANQAPVVYVYDQSNDEGTLINYPIMASDPDMGDTITEYMVAGLPPGLSYSSSMGTISGTIADVSANTDFAVQVKAKDNHNLWSEFSSFTWTVTDKLNHAPVLYVYNQTNDEGTMVWTSIMATDPDMGDVITEYIVEGLPPGLTPTLMMSSINISGTLGNVAANTDYAVRIMAKDNHNLWSDWFPFTWTVKNINHSPMAAPDYYSGSHDTPITGNVLANDTDPDFDPLTVDLPLLSQPMNGTVVIENGGSFTYTPNPSWHGTDSFTYSIKDGNGGTSMAMVSLVVHGPLFTTPADQQSKVGEYVTLNIYVNNPTGSNLILSADGLPDGLSFQTFGQYMALISGTVNISALDTELFSVTISASNSEITTTGEFSWAVISSPPVLSVPENMTVDELVPIIFDVSATDENGIASVEWWISSQGGDWELLPNLTTLYPTYTFQTYGQYDLYVSVTDNAGETSEAQFHVTARNVQENASVSATEVALGETTVFTITVFNDLDIIDTVSFYADWTGSGDFVLLDESEITPQGNGTYYFNHKYDAVGTYTAQIRLGDDDETDNVYYPGVVIHAPAAPTGTLAVIYAAGRTSYSKTVGNSTTYIIGAGDKIEFQNVTGNLEKLEYHYIIDGVETVSQSPSIELTDFTFGNTYQISGFVKFQDLEYSSAVTQLSILIGNYHLNELPIIAGIIPLFSGARPNGNADYFELLAPPANQPQMVTLIDVYTPSSTDNEFSIVIDENVLKAIPDNIELRFVYSGIISGNGALIPIFNNVPSTSRTFKIDGISPDRIVSITVQAAFLMNTNSGLRGQRFSTTANSNSPDFPSGLPFLGSNSYSFKARTPPPTPTPLDTLLNGFEAVRTLLNGLGTNAAALVDAVMRDPGRLLTNLLEGVRGAFSDVFDTIAEGGVLSPIFDWLKLAPLTPGGSAPTFSSDFFNNFSFENTRTEDVADKAKKFLLEYSGLTWDHIKQVIQSQLGAGHFAAAEKIGQMIIELEASPINPSDRVLTFLSTLREKLGNDYADALANLNLTTIANGLFDNIKAQLIGQLAQLGPRLAAKFVPGVGIATSIYQGITFIRDNQGSLSTLFDDFKASLGDLAASVNSANTSIDPFKNRLVTAIKRVIPVLIGFGMSQLGLGSIPQRIRNAVQYIPTQVDSALRRMVSAIARKVVALVPGGNGGLSYQVGQIGEVLSFQYNNATHKLWVEKDRLGTRVKILLPGAAASQILRAENFDNQIRAGARARLTALVTAAGHVVTAAGQMPNPATPNSLTITQSMTAFRTALNAVRDDILGNACKILNSGCFAAGTKLWTPDGYRNVEDIEPGELVFSRDEHDPFGKVEAKIVEEKFSRTGRILHIHLPGDKLIRTTPEHPFYVYDKGWRQAGELTVGSVIRTDAGWIEIEELFDTGEYEWVYNLRVADHHTYFVGEECWGFGAWAHNTACEIAAYRSSNSLPVYNQNDGSTGTVAQIKHNGVSFWGRSENLPGSLSASEQSTWFNNLKNAGYLSVLPNLTSAIFLRHAEAQAVIELSKSVNPIPESIVLCSDRVTCGYACKRFLPDLFKFLGIKNVSITWTNMRVDPLTWNETTGWNR